MMVPKAKPPSPDTSPAVRTKRAYLARNVRRESLLRAASEIVEKRGWDELSMIGLAEYAGVSRQLVYQHFDSLETLTVETGTRIFDSVYAETLSVVRAFEGDIAETLARAQHLTLDLPPGRARALWQVIAAGFPDDHELGQFGRRIRSLLTAMWQPAAAKAFGLDEKRAATVTWMLLMSFWGGYQLMEDGAVTKEEAIESLNWLITRVAAGVRIDS